MKKRILNILFIIYAVIAIFVTVCLLSYNKFKVTEFGNNTFIIITDDELAPEFNKGDLVIANKKSLVTTGHKAFFYSIANRKIEIKLATVEGIEKVTNKENTYMLEGDRTISGEYLIGDAETAEVVPIVGGILNILESKLGFLFLIVLPSFLAFIYQLSIVIAQIKEKK